MHREYRFRVVLSGKKFSLWLLPSQTIKDARKVIQFCDLAGAGCAPKLILDSEILAGNTCLFELKLGPSDEIVAQPRYGSRERAARLQRDLAKLRRDSATSNVDDCIDALDVNFGNVYLARRWLSGASGGEDDVGFVGQMRETLLREPTLLSSVLDCMTQPTPGGTVLCASALVAKMGLNPADFDLPSAAPHDLARGRAGRREEVITRLVQVAPDLGRSLVEQIYDSSCGHEGAATQILRELVEK
jgi:hypothetical protein